jgi:3-isopropylmalate/(R)-2-methylmalate dehydratase small subunit
MKPFKFHEGLALPLDAINVDTDQILPARFLQKRRLDPDYNTYLFHDLRYDKNGCENKTFLLNNPLYNNATIIVGNSNFGGGSSREAAVFALDAFGIRSVIAPNFGDIFFNNCFKNGILPVVLEKKKTDRLRALLHSNPGSNVKIDLSRQTVSSADGVVDHFDVSPTAKHNLMMGLGQIGLTMKHSKAIDDFELRYKANMRS